MMASSDTRPSPAANPDLFGHADAVRALEQAMASARLHHGWLISGRRGIGKATLAYRFARALLAGRGGTLPELTLPSDHPVFRQIAGGHHPDLKVIEAERDPKTGKIKAVIPVDKVRDATADLYRTPALAERRVLMVDGAEQLNRNAANALLKPLEEPPAGAVLVLISHRPGQVAATLRSRCAKLALRGLDEPTLLRELARQASGLSDAESAAIAALAKGSLGRALELADGSWLESYEQVARTVVAGGRDALALDDLAGSLAKQSAKDGFPRITDLIQTLFGRLIAQKTSRLGPPLFAEEAGLLGQLAEKQPLERWAALWEKIAHLSTAVDGLNLDHTQALTQILAAMASPPAKPLPFTRQASSLGSSLLGERHVVG